MSHKIITDNITELVKKDYGKDSICCANALILAIRNGIQNAKLDEFSIRNLELLISEGLEERENY